MSFEKWESDKDPDDVKDYGIRWAPALAGQNGEADDVLVSSQWIVTPNTLTIESDQFDGSTGITTVWFSGGLIDQTYLCTNRVVTAGGRTYDQTMKLKVKAR